MFSIRSLALSGAIVAALIGLSQESNAQNATSMAQVRTVWLRRATGNAFFNRNLRVALQARGLRFTQNSKRADAWLETSGQGTKDGGFAGQMTFFGRGNQVLRREKVVRPANSRVMAYQSLARKFPRR